MHRWEAVLSEQAFNVFPKCKAGRWAARSLFGGLSPVPGAPGRCWWGRWPSPRKTLALAVAVAPGAGGERQGQAGLPVPGEPPAPEPKHLLESARDVVAEPPAPAWPRAMQCSAAGTCEVGTGPGAQGWRQGCGPRKTQGELRLDNVVFKQALAKQFKYFNIITNT